MSRRGLGWKEIPMGAVCWRPATEYRTGTWRSTRPLRDEAKCTKCLLCWVYCPEGAVKWDGEEVSIDYDFCKGCGICARECPADAIEMVGE